MIKEIWKRIPGHPDYEASNLGRVRSLDKTVVQEAKNNSVSTHTYRGQLLKPQAHKNGYLFVTIDKKPRSVHRIICTTFIPNTENKKYVNHKDGNKGNNSVDNLEWCTASENMIHASQHGLLNYSSERYREAHRNALKKAQEKNRVAVDQYSLDGTFIRRFDSFIEAAGGNPIHSSRMVQVAKGRKKSACGYIWRYASE